MRHALFDGRVPTWLLPGVWILFSCYLAAVLLTGFLFDRSSQRMVRHQIDDELRVAATMVQASFPTDLRARVDTGPPLDAAEDRRLTRLANRLCADSGITYLYALYADDAGVVRHLWTCDPDGEIADDSSETWFGRPYEDCADAARQAIASGCGLHYETYTDHWGDFRGAYLGQRDAQGRNYAIGADIALAEIDKALLAARRNVAVAAAASALAGLGLCVGLHLLLRRLQRAQRDLSLLAAVAQGTGHAVLLAGPDGAVRYANAACGRHLAIEADALIGRRLSDIFGHADVARAMAAAVRGSGGACEIPGPGAPAATWLLADLRPVANPGGPPWVVCLLRDLSQNRAVQEELEHARNQAERVAAAKTAFLANMSHEIRTPLNGILGMTGLLLERRLEPADRELVQVAHNSGEVLLRLLGDILDLTKIEAQAMPIIAKPCDLHAVVEEVVRLFRTNAESKGLGLSFSSSVPQLWVVADGMRLRQVLANLVSNAIKFTETGTVTVELGTMAQGEMQRVRLAVVDTGIGIPPDRQVELFQPFVQVDDSMTRRAGGTGLGLAISRKLVELMGGSLALASEPGAGSRFTVEVVLPPARAPSGQVAALRSQPRR
ncbi:MAG: PAS domain-containing protein, partial [Planctomycetes bacterium]|nr:PAS domain-containing protein [Planctomycetota bacterium]